MNQINDINRQRPVRAVEPKKPAALEAAVPKPVAQQPAAAPPAPKAAAPEPERPGAPTLSEARKGQIDGWVDQNKDATGGWWIFTDNQAGDRVAEALKGESDLGRLNSAEMDYLAGKATDHFAQGNRGEAIREAAAGVSGDPAASAALARAYAQPAADDQAHFATGGTTLNTAEGNAARHDLLREAVRLDPAATVEAFADNEDALAKLAVQGMGATEVQGLMQAVSDRRIPAEAADRLVSAAFVQSDAGDVKNRTTREAMADALAMIRRPGTEPADAAARDMLSERLEGVMATGGGRDLLFGENIRPEQRAWAFEQVMTDDAWNADTLQDGWTSDTVTTAFAGSANEKFAAIPPQQELEGNALRNTVGQAMGAEPDLLPGEDETPDQASARVAAGMDHAYYSDESAAAEIATKIEEAGGPGARVSVVPVTLTSNDFGAATIPVFRVDRADGSSAFVDNAGHTYRDFEHWRTSNTLPEGKMAYSEGLQPGAALAKPENTPGVTDTFGEWAGKIGDYVALGAGIVAGGALIIGTGGTGALLVAAGAGAWMAGRAGTDLAAEHDRGGDILDFSDPNIRSKWLDVAAGTLSLGALGAGVKVATSVKNGVGASQAMMRATQGLAIAADLADATQVVDQTVQLSQNWDQLSNGERAMGVLNVAFWAGMTGASMRAGQMGANPNNGFERVQNLAATGTPYPMSANDALSPGEMRVTYDLNAAGDRVGNVRIEHGPGEIDMARLDLHTATAAQMEKAGGLRDQFASIIGNKKPEIGSDAWEAKLEIDKIAAEAEALAKLPADTPEQRAQIETRQRELDQAMVREQERLTGAAAGNGFVAAPRSLDDMLELWSASGNISRTIPDHIPALDAPTAKTPKKIELGDLVEVTGPNGKTQYQATGIEATITKDMIRTGSTADGGIKDLAGWEGGSKGHSRGHLLARLLGGSGTDRRNLVTMYQSPTNSPVMSDFERIVADAVEAGEVVNYRVTPVYDGPGMPTSVVIQAKGSEGLDFEITLHNIKGE